MKTLVTVLVVAAVSAGGMRIARAEDAKIMSGGACLPLLTPAAIASGYNPWTEIRIWATNAFTGTLTFFCPVTREATTTTTGISRAAVVVELAQGARVSCLFVSWGEFGSSHDAERVTFTNEGGGGARTTLAFGEISSVANGLYAISCDLPARAKILSYRWTER